MFRSKSAFSTIDVIVFVWCTNGKQIAKEVQKRSAEIDCIHDGCALPCLMSVTAYVSVRRIRCLWPLTADRDMANTSVVLCIFLLPMCVAFFSTSNSVVTPARVAYVRFRMSGELQEMLGLQRTTALHPRRLWIRLLLQQRHLHWFQTLFYSFRRLSHLFSVSIWTV